MGGNHTGHGTTVGAFLPKDKYFPSLNFLAREENNLTGKLSGSTKAIYEIGSKIVSLQSISSTKDIKKIELPESITNPTLSEFQKGEEVEILCNYSQDKVLFQKFNDDSHQYYPSDFLALDGFKSF
jgi:hypothetical protein